MLKGEEGVLHLLCLSKYLSFYSLGEEEEAEREALLVQYIKKKEHSWMLQENIGCTRMIW